MGDNGVGMQTQFEIHFQCRRFFTPQCLCDNKGPIRNDNIPMYERCLNISILLSLKFFSIFIMGNYSFSKQISTFLKVCEDPLPKLRTASNRKCKKNTKTFMTFINNKCQLLQQN